MDDQAAKQNKSENAGEKEQGSPQQRIVDPNDLVYVSSYSEEEGSISDDPREIINNPAVAPEMLDTTPENLRDDFFKTPPAG